MAHRSNKMNNKIRYLGKFLVSFFSRLNFRRMEECASILRWLDPGPGERILDIGCGDGYYDTLAAKKGAEIVGIDIHESRLALAQNYRSGEKTEFLYMDAEKMDFPAAYFDKVMSLCVIEHLHDDDLVMQNVSRVIKPGGNFVFSADSFSHPGISAAERARHKKRYAVNTFYTHENIKDKLARAGFAVEETRYILCTPFALGLIRLSWKLDDLPGKLKFAGFIGYMGLWLVWQAASLFHREAPADAPGGLTILVRARKLL